jgi:hypothetical protein
MLSLLFSRDLFRDRFVSPNLCQSFTYKMGEKNGRLEALVLMLPTQERIARRWLRVVSSCQKPDGSFPVPHGYLDFKKQHEDRIVLMDFK